MFYRTSCKTWQKLNLIEIYSYKLKKGGSGPTIVSLRRSVRSTDIVGHVYELGMCNGNITSTCCF